METLIRIVGQYAQWIYALCGFTALYNIYKTWQIRGERRQAVFTLERQKAVDDLYKILFTSLLLLTIMGTTYFVGDVLAGAMGIERPPRSLSENFGTNTVGSVLGDIDALENSGQQATTGADSSAASTTGDVPQEGNGETTTNDTITDPSAEENAGTNESGNTSTDELTAEATSSNDPFDPSAQADSAPVTIDANAALNIAVAPTAAQTLPTPTFTYAPPPPPPPTIVPTTAPVVSSPLCTDARARINNPSNGSIVSGSFNIVGSATHEQFQFYKIEYAPGANTDQAFVYLAGGNNPINGGVLTTVDSTIWPNGIWTIRIVVVDQTGNFPPPCNVTITVSN